MAGLLQHLRAAVRPHFRDVEFGGIDTTVLDLPRGISVHHDVAEYLSTCIPSDYLPIYVYELRSVFRDFVASDEKRVPMAYEFYPTADFIFINSGAQSRLTAHGFIEIGSDNGHALAFDVVHGTLFRFDPVDPFIEGEDCTDEIQRRYESPVDAEGIRKFALIRYASFPHFCNEALFASKIDRKLKQSGRDDGSALSEEMWRELLRET